MQRPVSCGSLSEFLDCCSDVDIGEWQDADESFEPAPDPHCSSPVPAGGPGAATSPDEWRGPPRLADVALVGGPASGAVAGEAAHAHEYMDLKMMLWRYKKGEDALCKTVGGLLTHCKQHGTTLDELEAALADAEAQPEGDEDQEMASGASSNGGGGGGGGGGGDRGSLGDSGCEGGGESGGEGGGARADAAGRRDQQQKDDAAEARERRKPGSWPTGARGGPGELPRPSQQRSPGVHWTPTAGDCLIPGVKELPSSGLGMGGSDLFSAAHVAGHVRAAAGFMEQLESSKGWRQLSFGALHTWHYHDKGAELHHFKAQCVIEEPLLNILCLCREVDLGMTWNPTLSVYTALVQCGFSELLIYMSIWLPWPFREPEVLMRGLGLDLLASHGAYVMSLQDVGDPVPSAMELPPGSAARTRYRLHPGCMWFTPLAPDPATGNPRLDATVIITLDARRVLINDTLISFFLKVFAPLVYRSVNSACRRIFHPRPGSGDASPLVHKMRERPDLYLMMASSIDKWMRERGLPEQMPHLPVLQELKQERERKRGDKLGAAAKAAAPDVLASAAGAAAAAAP